MTARTRAPARRRPPSRKPQGEAAVDDAPRIAEFADACVRSVQRSLGLTLDYHPDSISLLDHYLLLLPDRPRAPTRDPVRGLVATLTGAYFGSVVYRLFPCRWVAPADSDPLDWRLEFRYGFLTFHPVAVAWEVLLRRDFADCTAAYLLEAPTRDVIAERLDSLPGATLDDYYTFAQRLETLVLTAGWLAEDVQQTGKPPVEVAATRYARFLAKLRTRE
jgi:hypothetical protein